MEGENRKTEREIEWKPEKVNGKKHRKKREADRNSET